MQRSVTVILTIPSPVLVNCIEVDVRRVRNLNGSSPNLSIEWNVLSLVYLQLHSINLPASIVLIGQGHFDLC